MWMMDFESSEISAWQNTIGNDLEHNVRGCNFHYCQAILHYVKDKGYSSQFQDLHQTELRGTIFLVLGLAYVRPTDRLLALEIIKEKFSNLEGEDEAMFLFLQQFVDNYVIRFWLEGNIDPESWNYWKADDHVTNNAAESGNNQFFSDLHRQKSPNINIFFKSAVNILTDGEIKLRQFENTKVVMQ